MPDDSLTIDSVEASPMESSSIRTSSRTSTTTFDPLAMADFTKNAVSLSSNIDQALETTVKVAAQRKAAEAAQQAQILEYSKAVGEATTASAAIEAGEAQRRTSILNSGNINPDVLHSQINKAFSIINSNAAVLEPMGKDIDSRMAIGIYDNPLEFLVNQVRLPGLVGQYNALAGNTNRAVETVRTLQALAGTQQALSSAMDADKIQVAGVAKAAAAASAAQAKLSEAQVSAASNAARDAANLLAMSGKKYDIALDKVRLTREQKAFSEGMSESDRRKAEEQILVDQVNDYLNMIGGTGNHTVGTLRMNKNKTLLQDLSGTGVISKKFSVGFSAVDEFGNPTRLAGEGGATAVNWMKATAAQANQSVGTLAANYTAKGMKAPKAEDLRTEALDTLQEKYTLELQDMRRASPSNPARLEYSFLAKQPIFAGNKVAEFIQQFGPESKTPTFKHPDESIILDRLAADVFSGTATVAEAAAHVSEFYSKAVAIQAEQTKYPLFGLPYIASYNVDIPEGRFEKSRGSTDLTKPANVEALLTRLVAKKAHEQLMTPLLQGS